MEKIAEFFIRLFLNLPCIPVFGIDILSMKEGAAQYAADTISSLLNSIAGLGGCMSDTLAMSDSSFIGGVWLSLKGVITDGIDSMAGLGITIALGMWLVSIVELTIQDRLTPEMLIKSLVKVVFAACLCDIASALYLGIVDFGNGLQTDIANFFGSLSFGDFGDNEEDIAETIRTNILDDDSLSWISIYINVTIMVLPVYLFQMIMLAVTYVIQLTRVIELNVRAIFLPISFGMLADDGWRGAGGRYIRKFIAICAQGAVLVCIGGMTTAIMGGALASVAEDFQDLLSLAEGLTMVVGVGIAMMAVMFKSIGIVNDVFGG